jgi:hypothetical protein
MADVGYHFSNLWFAGRGRNWPLATYYYNEVRKTIINLDASARWPQ